MRSRGSTPDGRMPVQGSDENRDGQLSVAARTASTSATPAARPTQLVEGDENHKITVHTSLTDDTLQDGDGGQARPTATVVDVAPTLTVSVIGDAIGGLDPDGACGSQGSDENRDGQLSVAARRRRHQQRQRLDLPAGRGPTRNHKITVHTSLTDDTLQTVTGGQPHADGDGC